jgi:hypothetical protein
MKKGTPKRAHRCSKPEGIEFGQIKNDIFQIIREILNCGPIHQ